MSSATPIPAPTTKANTTTTTQDGPTATTTAQQPKPKSKRSPQQIQNPSSTPHHHHHSDEEADLIVSSPTITTSEKTGMTPGDPTTTTTTTTGSNEHPTTNEHSSGPSSHRQSTSPQRSPPTTYDSSALSHNHHSVGGASFNPSLSTKCASTTSIPSAAPLHTSSSNPPSRKSTSSSRGNNDGTAPSTDEENKTVNDTNTTSLKTSNNKVGGAVVEGISLTAAAAKPASASNTASGGVEGGSGAPAELDVEDTASSTDIAPKRRRRRRRRVRHPHGHADHDDQGGSGATGVTGHTGDTTSTMMSDAGGTNHTHPHSSHPTPHATTTTATNVHNNINSRPPRGLGFEESQSGGGSDQGGGSAYVSEEDDQRVPSAQYRNTHNNHSFDHHYHDAYYPSSGGEYQQQHDGFPTSYPQHHHHQQQPQPRQWNAAPRHFPDVSFPDPYYNNHTQYQQQQHGGNVRSGRGGSVSSGGSNQGGAPSRLRMAVPGMHQTSTYPPAGSTRAGSNATTDTTNSGGSFGGSTRGDSPMMPPVASDGGWGPGASGAPIHIVRAHSSASSVASNSANSVVNHHASIHHYQATNTASSQRSTPTKLPPHPPPLPPNARKGSLQQMSSHPPTPSSTGGPTSSSAASQSSSSSHRNINYYYRRLLDTPNRRGTDDPEVFARRIDARIRAREAAERRSSSAPCPIASSNVPPFDFRVRFPSSQNVLYYIYVEEPNDDNDADNNIHPTTRRAPKFYPELLMVLGLDAAAQYESEIGYNEDDEITQLNNNDSIAESNNSSVLPLSVTEEQLEHHQQQPVITTTTPKVVQQQRQTTSSPSTPNTVIKRRNNPYDAVNSTTLVRCSSTSSIEGDSASSSSSSRHSPIAESDCNIFASAVESAATAHITSLVGGGGSTSTAPTPSGSPVSTTQHNQQHHPKTIPATVAPAPSTTTADNNNNNTKATNTPTTSSPTSPIQNSWQQQQQQQRANRGTWFSDANNQERLQYTGSGSLSAAGSLDGTKRRLPPQLAEKLKQAATTTNEVAPTTPTTTSAATQQQSKPTHQDGGGSTTPTPSTKDSNPSTTNDDDSTITAATQPLPSKTSTTDMTPVVDETTTNVTSQQSGGQSHIHTVVMRSGSRSSRNSSRSRGGSQRSRESSSDSGPRGGRGRRGGSIPPPSSAPPVVAARTPETTTVIHHSHQPIPPPGGLVPPEFSRVAPSSPYLYHQQRLYSGVGGAPLLPPGHSTIHAVQQRIYEQQQHYDQQHQRSQSGNVSPQLVPLSRRPVGPRGLVPIGEDADMDSATTPEQQPTASIHPNSTTMTVMHLDVDDSLEGARLAAAEMLHLNALKPDLKKKHPHSNIIAESIATTNLTSKSTPASLAEVARLAAAKHQSSRSTPSTPSTPAATTVETTTTTPLPATSTRRNKGKPTSTTTAADVVVKTPNVAPTTPAATADLKQQQKPKITEPSAADVLLSAPSNKKAIITAAPSTPIAVTTKSKKSVKSSLSAAVPETSTATTTTQPLSPHQTTTTNTTTPTTTPMVEKQHKREAAVSADPITSPLPPPSTGGYMNLDMKVVAKFLEEQEDIMKAKKERQKEQQRIKEEELQQQQLRQRQQQQQSASKNKTKPSTTSTPSTPTVVKNNKKSSKPGTPEVAIPSGSRSTPTTSQKKSKSGGGNDDDLLDALIAQNDQERKKIKQQQQQSPKATTTVQNTDDSRSQAESITRRNQAILLAAAEAAAKRQRRCNSGGSHRGGGGLIHSDGDDLDDLEQDGATLELGDECSGTSTAEEDHHHLGLVSSAGVVGSGTPSHSTDEHIVDDERIYYTDDSALFDNLDRVGDFSPAQVEAFISATTAASLWRGEEENEVCDSANKQHQGRGVHAHSSNTDVSEDFNWCIPVEAIGGVDIAHFPSIDVRTLNEASIAVLEALVVANRLRLPVHKSLQVAERHLSTTQTSEGGGGDIEMSPFSHLTAIAPNMLPQHRIGVLQEVERIVQQSLSSQASPNNRILCLQPLIANNTTTTEPTSSSFGGDMPLLAHVSYEQCLRLLSWQQATGIAATIDAAQRISDQTIASCFSDVSNTSSSPVSTSTIDNNNNNMVYFNEALVFGKSKQQASFAGSSTSLSNSSTNATPFCTVGALSIAATSNNNNSNAAAHNPSYYPPAIGHPTLLTNTNNQGSSNNNGSHAAFNSTRITTTSGTTTNIASSSTTPSSSLPSPSSYPATTTTSTTVGSAVSKSRNGGGGNGGGNETVLVSHPASNTNLLRVVEEHAGCRQILENLCSQPYPAAAMERSRQLNVENLSHHDGENSDKTKDEEHEGDGGIAELQAEFEAGIVEDALRVYHREICKDAVLARGKALLARRKCILRHRSVVATTTNNIVKASSSSVVSSSQTAAPLASATTTTQQQNHASGSANCNTTKCLPLALPAPYAAIRRAVLTPQQPPSGTEAPTLTGPNYMDNIIHINNDATTGLEWVSSLFVVPPPQAVATAAESTPLPYHPNCTLSHLQDELLACRPAVAFTSTATSSATSQKNQNQVSSTAPTLASSIITTNNARTTCCPLIGAWLMSELAIHFIDAFDRAMLYSRKAVALAAIEASHPQMGLKQLYRTIRNHQQDESNVTKNDNNIVLSNIAYMPMVSLSAPYFTMVSTLLQGHFHEQHMEPVLTKGMCQRTIGTALELGEGLALGHGCYLMALSMELLGSNPDSFALLQFSKGIALGGLPLVPSWKTPSTATTTNSPSACSSGINNDDNTKKKSQRRKNGLSSGNGTDVKLLMFSLARVGASLTSIGNYDAGEELGRAALGLLRGALGIQVEGSRPDEGTAGLFSFGTLGVRLPARDTYLTTTGHPHTGPAPSSRALLQQLVENNNNTDESYDSTESSTTKEVVVSPAFGYSPATSAHYFYNVPLSVHTLLQASTSVIPSNVASVLQILQQTPNLDLHLSLLHEELHTVMTLGDMTSSTTPLMSLAQVKLHLGCYLASYQDHAAEGRILDLINTGLINTPPEGSSRGGNNNNNCNTVAGVLNAHSAAATRPSSSDDSANPLSMLASFPMTHTPNCRREADSIFNGAVCLRTIAEYGCLQREWEHPLVMWSGDVAVGGRRFALRYAEELAKTHNLPPAPYTNKKTATLSEVAGWYRRVMRTAARLDSFENASCSRQHYLTTSPTTTTSSSSSASTTTAGLQLQDYSLSSEGVELALMRSIEMLRKCKAFSIHSTSAADVEGGSARDCFMWTPRVLSELGDTDGRAAWVLWQRQVQRQVSIHAQHRADPTTSSAKIIAQSQIIKDISSQFTALYNKKEETTMSTDDIEIRLVQPSHLFDAPTVKVNLTSNPDVYHLITPTPTWSVQSRISTSIYQQYEALIEHEKTSDQSLNTIVGNCETEWRLLDAMERLMVQSGDHLGALMACDRRHCPNTAEITPMLRRRCGLPVQSPHTVLARLNSQGVGLAVLKPQFPNKSYPLPHLKRPNWAPSYSTAQSPAHPQVQTTSTQPHPSPSPAHLAVHRTVRRRERLCGLENETDPTTTPSSSDHIAVAEQEAQMEVDTFKISITAVVEALPNNGNGALIGGGGGGANNNNNASTPHNNNSGGAKKLPGGKKIVGAKGGVVTATSQQQQGPSTSVSNHTTPNNSKTHPFASYEDLLADTAHALMLSKSFDPAQLRDFVEGGSPSRIRLAIIDALAKLQQKSNTFTPTASPQLVEWLVNNEAALNSFLSASSEWPYDAMVVYSMFWSADDVVGAFVVTREQTSTSIDDSCFAYRMNIEHKWLPLDTKFWSVLLNPQSAYVQLQVSGGNRFDTPLTPQRAVFAGMRAPLFDSDDECEGDESNALPYDPTYPSTTTSSSTDLPRYLGCLKTQMGLLYDTLVAPLTPYLNAAGVSLHNNNDVNSTGAVGEDNKNSKNKKAPTVCFVADGYIGHIPYSVLYNKATQRYMFQDCVVTVSPSILHLLSMVCQQRSAAVMNIISGYNHSSTTSPLLVPHTHVSSYVGDETECGLSKATSFNTYRLIQQQQDTIPSSVVLPNQLIVPLHVEEDQLPQQADILPSIYSKRGPQKLLAHIAQSTPLATLQQQLVLEADAMDAEVQMIEVLATAPTIDTSRRGEAVERLLVCSRRSTALRNAFSSINVATPTEDAIQIASSLVEVTDIALSARPPSSCYTGFDRFCKDVSRPHQLLPHKDLLDYTATLCTQLQLKQKDTVVSNLLFRIVHAETNDVAAEPHQAAESSGQTTRCGGGSRGALILNIPCAIDQREEFCSNLCLEPYRFVAPSSSIAAVWEVAAYPLVVLPSIGRFAVRAIHETSIPCFRSLLVAGAPRLMMPLWAIPESEHYDNQHSRLHDLKNNQLAETLAFITKNRVPFNIDTVSHTHPPCNNSVLLASRSLDCAHSGRGKDAGTTTTSEDAIAISEIVGSLSALVTYTQNNHMNTGVAHALHQQMSHTLHTLRSSQISNNKDTFSEEIIACGYWTFEGLP